MALWLAVRSDITVPTGRKGSFKDTDDERCDALEGDGGGGMEIPALDRRPRGVEWVIVLDRVGVPEGGPMVPVVRTARGVNGELDARGEVMLEVGDDMHLVGLLTVALLGLLAPETRLLNCLAVIPMYFEARDPGVNVDSTVAILAGVIAVLRTIVVVL